MLTVTLDTNILPADDIIGSVATSDFEFAVVSVTNRELGAAGASSVPDRVSTVSETAMWDESNWDSGLWGGLGEAGCLHQALDIISEGSFPRPPHLPTLTAGQRRQLRDAMIFCAHVRDKRHILVTNDERGFVRNNRRVKLETIFNTRILTRNEFLAEFAGK